MTIQQFGDFYAICKKAGFNTLAEVDAFMNGNCTQSDVVCINGVLASDEDLAELIRRVVLGKEFAVARRYKGFAYITTRG